MNATQHIQHRASPVIGNGYANVCAWCWPGQSVFESYPELRRCTITHGICPECHERFLAALEEVRKEKR